MSGELRAELIMAVGGYQCEKKENWDEGVDLVASDCRSKEKILLRVIENPGSDSGVVGVDAVRKMVQVIEEENYDRGILISESFSDAAKDEMVRRDIQIVSDKVVPRFEPRKLYDTIQKCIDRMCKIKCGRIPQKESECNGKNPERGYICQIRRINDNALFHFERGWMNFLKEDLKQLLIMQK